MTVAVLGAHPNSEKPAHFVPANLKEQGYRIIPVNPGYVGEYLWEEPVRKSLAGFEEPVDVVDVFRRSDVLPEHLEEILAMDPRPAVVWFQQGIRNDEVTRKLIEKDIDVVQDQCMLANHKRLYG